MVLLFRMPVFVYTVKLYGYHANIVGMWGQSRADEVEQYREPMDISYQLQPMPNRVPKYNFQGDELSIQLR